VRIIPELLYSFTISPGESGRDSLWGFIENGILEREGGITKGFLTHNPIGAWKDRAY